VVSTEVRACWAALVAYVEDVHAPQDQLSEKEWKAAEVLVRAIPDPAATVEDEILANALLTMLGEIDAPDMPEDRWLIADRMLAEYTALVETPEAQS
jgi:hypothetical protein